MSVSSEFQRFKDLNLAIGKKALNALFPDDIEIYIFALEIVNSDKETEDYFIFPINPNSINEPYNPIQSIKKTAGGITILNTTTFTPTKISIQGNFGRKFKFLLGQEVVNFSSINFKPSLNDSKPTFNKSIKTGYGCLKVLEGIVKKSNTLDKKGQPYALFFYNLALGNNYLVKVVDFNSSMNQEGNMIWNYNLTLESLIKIEDITEKNQRSLTTSLSANSVIQNTINNIGNSILALIP